jgi:hypothetical protein
VRSAVLFIIVEVCLNEGRLFVLYNVKGCKRSDPAAYKCIRVGEMGV